MAAFPNVRLRRKRLNNWLLNLTRENELSVNDLILPLFVHNGTEIYEPIAGLPNIKCYPIINLLSVVEEAKSLGINAIALFPVVENSLKTENAYEAYNPNNLICSAIRQVKSEFGSDIGIIADVALDPYTTYGHDGIVIDGKIANDETIPILCKQALVLAAAGCDVVAPSDMMDGRIQAIRAALDNSNFQDILILSYAVKYCSGFYAPFRQAVGSCSFSSSIDKSSYQLDFGNAKEAMREIQMDIDEAADIIMIKPGMPYLDVIRVAADKFDIPIFAYQVSGEYAMLKAASEKGWLEYDKVIYESLLSFKRAGAKSIFTYAALEIAKTNQLKTI
ncbi:porphobilinogen synthase [Candidatus Mesenet endosymbiont of Agriotes lineatus]|uniref:porphobilinogen synthase n=1 Tax=Candidatus Mesenet endosymbiont of Agriotes lineatus TaxID=3077948 RepID=UPI0030CC0CE2